eukprot:TRINITY_DN23125_c0_g1_i1.p1 TRINITY_DN23125_c0_g1~~TRINITY_DN23125_c0_g1_i1.p1  ORF type:complete len:500 (+),score=67.39 TRINITY_DN23125_c0_g1_i1:145-1644(+)
MEITPALEPGYGRHERFFNDRRFSDQIIRLVAPAPSQITTLASSPPSFSSACTSLDVSVSKAILAAASVYFETCLTTEVGDGMSGSAKMDVDDDLGETIEPFSCKRVARGKVLPSTGKRANRDVGGVLCLEVPSIEVGLELLRFPYSDTVSDSFVTSQSLLDLLICADKYMMIGAVRKCLERLQGMSLGEEESATLMLRLPPDLADNTDRRKALVEKLAQTVALSRYPNMAAVEADQGRFLAEPFEVVKAIITNDNFHTPSEESLVFFVIRWIRKNSAAEDVQEKFTAMVPHIRFASLATCFLVSLCRIPAFMNLATIALTRKNIGGPLQPPQLHFDLLKEVTDLKLFAPPRPGAQPGDFTLRFPSEQVLELLQSEKWKRLKGDSRVVQGFRFEGQLVWWPTQTQRKLYVCVQRLEEEKTVPPVKLFDTQSVMVELSYCWPGHEAPSSSCAVLQVKGTPSYKRLAGPLPENPSADDKKAALAPLLTGNSLEIMIRVTVL